jgi:hypothetical protein
MGKNNNSQSNVQAGAAKVADKLDKAALKSYTVVSELDHDGERFEAGDSVELTAAEAAPLIKYGVVVDAEASAAAQAAAEEAAALEAERQAEAAQKALEAADMAAAEAAKTLGATA